MPSSTVPRIARLLCLLAVITACTSDAHLKPFASDGCSLFPDRSLINRDDWCSCCVEHDIAYWKGGTQKEREVADAALRDCVRAKTGNKQLATLMYDGVRVGGSPYFYNWYRWGYGWSFERKYQPLTAAEAEEAARLLDAFRASGSPTACAMPRAKPP